MSVAPIQIAPLQSALPVETRARGRQALVLRLVTLGCVLSSPVWLWALLFSFVQGPVGPSLIFVPLGVLGCVVSFMPLWRVNPYLKQLLGAGILARLAAASLYIWIGVIVYDNSVDAFHYWSVGLQRADEFSVAGWSAFSPPYTSTNLINNVCGFIMLATGDSMPTLFVLFTLAALWGGYLFYRAFSIAFPEGDRRLFGMLAVLLPSNLFWSSAIGKDALAQLFIGLSAFGFARAHEKFGLRSVLICAAGVTGVLIVRPHVAAMLVIAMTLPFLVGKSRGGWKTLAIRIVLVPVLMMASVWVISQAGEFVGVESTDSDRGIAQIDRLTKSTQVGGSAFNEGQSVWMRVAESPFITFRPFPWEANNGMAAAASLEGLALLWFGWKRRRTLVAAARNWREPFVAFILVYSLLFSVAFAAATSNFGILVRERIMMVPLLLMLFCSNLRSVRKRRSTLAPDLVFLAPSPLPVRRARS